MVSDVARRAAQHEITQAIASIEAAERRTRTAPKIGKRTERKDTADILKLQAIPALRRAFNHLENS